MSRAEIILEAERVFGNPVKARLWLRRPNRALCGAAPLSLLMTSQGRERVQGILGRIEHGVYE